MRPDGEHHDENEHDDHDPDHDGDDDHDDDLILPRLLSPEVERMRMRHKSSGAL